ncbi:ABC transporter substrate-binding protein [Saccharomonospora sp. NPDC046836]|uniref:ABC transporter substrate-binding protein n=1 Tax=Saccharomonospora sp. NPDC046836 TaxID=3156921 RepID=UPI0033C95666
MTRSPQLWAFAALFTALGTLATACGAAADSAGDSGEAGARDTTVITDELGRDVEVEVPIRSVYTDLYYNAELVRAVGAGDRIVSIDDTADPGQNPTNAEYFANLAGATVVGNADEPNYEAIVESGAEVAVFRRNGPYEEAIEKLAPFGIEVLVITGWDPKVLREYVPVLGRAFGTEEPAAEVAALYDDISDVLDHGLQGVQPRRVYFENNADFITALPGSGWHDAIVEAGGTNIYGDVQPGDDTSASVHQYEVDPVDIIGRDPDAIIHVGVDGQVYGYDTWDRELSRQQAGTIADRPGWQAVTAVRERQVYVVDNFFFSALGKQIGTLATATWLHPEKFADVDLDEYFARWLEVQGVQPRPASDYIYRIGS